MLSKLLRFTSISYRLVQSTRYLSIITSSTPQQHTAMTSRPSPTPTICPGVQLKEVECDDPETCAWDYIHTNTFAGKVPQTAPTHPPTATATPPDNSNKNKSAPSQFDEYVSGMYGIDPADKQVIHKVVDIAKDPQTAEHFAPPETSTEAAATTTEEVPAEHLDKKERKHGRMKADAQVKQVAVSSYDEYGHSVPSLDQQEEEHKRKVEEHQAKRQQQQAGGQLIDNKKPVDKVKDPGAP